MKRKIILLATILAVSIVISAQTGLNNSGDSKNNFFISIGAGAQACMNPDNFDYDFGKAITPLFNFSVGKFISPVWGVRGQISFSPESKLYSQNYYWRRMYGNKAVKENYFGVNLDGYINLTNWFCGYKPNKKFELFFFMGPTLNLSKTEGYWLAYHETNPSGSETTLYSLQNNEIRWLIGGSAGLGGKYNINNHWSVDLEIRGTVTSSVYGCKSSAKTDGLLGVNVGVTYTFGRKKTATCANNEEELNKRINELQEQLKNNPEPKVIEKIVEKTIEKETTNEIQTNESRAIFFEIGKSDISEQGMINVKLAAKAISSNPTKKYKIIGYADEATGSKAINEKLSEKRAQSVFDALIKEGVTPNQLEITPMGGQPNMFGKNALNRVVILK